MNEPVPHRARRGWRVPAWFWLCLALGVIVYLLLPRFGAPSSNAKRSESCAKLAILDAALRSYYDDHKCFPSSLSQLAGPDGKTPPGRYTEAELRLDGWGHPFGYQVMPGGDVTLTSYGRPGTGDDLVIRISPGQATTRVAPESLSSTQPSSMRGD